MANIFRNLFKPKLKIRVNMKSRQLRALSRAQLQAAEMTVEAMRTEINIDKVVPKQDGTLEKSLTINTTLLNKGELKLSYDSPYARRLYYHPEFNFRTDKNENAKGLWLEDYIDGDKKDFARNTYAKLYARLTGV